MIQTINRLCAQLLATHQRILQWTNSTYETIFNFFRILRFYSTHHNLFIRVFSQQIGEALSRTFTHKHLSWQ